MWKVGCNCFWGGVEASSRNKGLSNNIGGVWQWKLFTSFRSATLKYMFGHEISEKIVTNQKLIVDKSNG